MALSLRPLPVLYVLIATVGLLYGCGSADDRASAHYKDGVALIAEGELKKASLEFRNAVRLKEGFIEALLALGIVEERQGHFDTAARLYLSVTEMAKGNLGARVRLVLILLAAGQTDVALKFADEAVAIAPSDTAALVAKAAVALKLEDRANAVRYAQAALNVIPNNADAFAALASERLLDSDAKGALQFLEQALATSERNLGLQLLRLSALEKLDNQPAIEDVLIRLAELYPETPAFKTGLARWYLSKGRMDDAEATLRRYAADDRSNVTAQLDLVAFLREQKGSAAASRELEGLIEGGDEVFPYRFALAELRFADGQQPEAVELLRALIADTTDETDRNKASVRLAGMLMAMDNDAEALQLVDQVIADDDKNVDALSMRASLRLEDGQIAESIADLVAAIDEAPESTALLNLLGEAYERSGAVELAEDQYLKVVQLSGYLPDAGLRAANFLLRYGKAEQAERLLDEVRLRTGDDRRVLSLLAQLKLTRHDWVGAQEVADALRVIDDGSDNQTVDEIRAAVLAGMGRHEEGIALLEATSNRSEGHLAALVRAYLRAGKQDTARDFLQNAIEADSSNIEAHILLGYLYIAQNKNDLARTSFDNAIAADPKNPNGYVALARFLLDSGNLEQALAVVRGGLAQQPDNNALALMLAWTLEAKKDYEGAITEYEKLVAGDSNSTIAANNLASLLSEHRTDPDSLERAYTIALRFRSSEIPQFLDTLGWIHHLRSDDASALGLLKAAADRMPENATVQYHLGMTLRGLGQNELAIAHLEKAIELASEGSSANAEKARSALDQLRSVIANGPEVN